MANENLSNITISFIKRNAPKRGPSSSELLNDSFDEIANDLTNLSIQWNTNLIPLTSTIPDGTDDEDVNAFLTGLDGSTLYVDSTSTSLNNVTYYNSTSERPNTVLEQFDNLYDYVDTQAETLQTEIDDLSVTASDVIIADSSGYFSSSNVEDALAELKETVVAVNDHGALTGLTDDDHSQYLPRSGVRSMTGNFDLGNYNITGVNSLSTTSLISSTATISAVVATTSVKTASLICSDNTDAITYSASAFQGNGIIISKGFKNQVVSTVSSSPFTLGITASKAIYTNISYTSGKLTLTLPASPTTGIAYTVYIYDSHGIRLQAQGSHTIRVLADLSGAAGYTESTTVGDYITLTYLSTNLWVATAVGGTWTTT